MSPAAPRFCKFADRCNKFGCTYTHPKSREPDCRYGPSCHNKRCTFRHPRSTTESSLALVPGGSGRREAMSSYTGTTSGGCKTVVRKEVVITRTIGGSGIASSRESRVASGHRKVIEAVLCFDTTGSMYEHLEQVRAVLVKLVAQLQTMCRKYKAVLRLGVIAHGDYCDKEKSYVIKFLPLCDADAADRIAKVVDFVKKVGPTYGGDAPECYELALHKASHNMGWGSWSRRLMVMVGDNVPHPVGYSCNGYTNTIDWKDELGSLAKQQVKVYAVEAGRGHSSEVTRFWSKLATVTKGKHLVIDAAATLSGIICCGIAKELGKAAYAEHGAMLQKTGRMHGEMKRVYEAIRTVITTTTVS